ncbi:aminotransferase class III-fold pyridoxal phosphate-dependent enzyme [Actinoplanes sp. NPDC049596]|uniref:aminotransferase class III-fold pyridoxal phosphate-dependent enzyme n=1 Tax=unclassified Actinoplanes TaxID=2626549 RepID=UPI00341E1AF5
MREYVRGSGAHIFTSDGDAVVDFVCGYGPVILGHGHERVNKAIENTLATGVLLPGSARLENQVRERLQSLFGDHRDVHFLKTGSDAVAASIRLARLATGRWKVARCGFHGWHDGLIDGKIGWHNWDNVRQEAAKVPGTLGAFSADGVELAAESTLGEFQRIFSDHGHELAAVVIDPIQLLDPEVELPAIRELARRSGALFILDETKTAFRTHPAGIDRMYSLRSDFIVAGKGLANGLPLSSVIADPSLLNTRKARIKGTFNAELAALAAASETLAVLEEEDGAQRLTATGTALIDGLNKLFAEHDVASQLSAVPYRWPSMPHVHAATDDPGAQSLRTAFIGECEKQGALFMDGHNSFLSLAHDVQDIDHSCAAAAAALEKVLR